MASRFLADRPRSDWLVLSLPEPYGWNPLALVCLQPLWHLPVYNMATILEKPSSRQLLSEIKEDELPEGGIAAGPGLVGFHDSWLDLSLVNQSTLSSSDGESVRGEAAFATGCWLFSTVSCFGRYNTMNVFNLICLVSAVGLWLPQADTDTILLLPLGANPCEGMGYPNHLVV